MFTINLLHHGRNHEAIATKYFLSLHENYYNVSCCSSRKQNLAEHDFSALVKQEYSFCGHAFSSRLENVCCFY